MTTTKTYQLESGIPMPPKTHHRAKYLPLLRAGKVGDSILMSRSSFYSAKVCAAREGIILEQRQMPDGQWRVWIIDTPLANRMKK